MINTSICSAQVPIFQTYLDPLLNITSSDTLSYAIADYADSVKVYSLVNEIRKLNDTVYNIESSLHVMNIATGNSQKLKIINDDCGAFKYQSVLVSDSVLYTLDVNNGLCSCNLKNPERRLKILHKTFDNNSFLLQNANYLFSVKVRPNIPEYPLHLGVEINKIDKLNPKLYTTFLPTTKGLVYGLLESQTVGVNDHYIFVANAFSQTIDVYDLNFNKVYQISNAYNMDRKTKFLEETTDSVYADLDNRLSGKLIDNDSMASYVKQIQHEHPIFGGSGIYYISKHFVEQCDYSVIENIYCTKNFLYVFCTNKEDSSNTTRVVSKYDLHDRFKKIDTKLVQCTKNSIGQWIDLFEPNCLWNKRIHFIKEDTFISRNIDYFDLMYKYPLTKKVKIKTINLEHKNKKNPIQKCLYAIFSL